MLIAKIKDGKRYSIITDHLGTPTQAYNEAGEKVWHCELDTYGKTNTFTGESSFIPFRYQGQYEDAETGLYYNRFRYYDAKDGHYISQDPIGFLSGEYNFYNYVSDCNSWVDIFGLKRTYEKVRAHGEIDGIKRTDLNQKARRKKLADPDKRTLIADKIEAENKKGKNVPNTNMQNAHAEIGVIQQFYDMGLTKGKHMHLIITGEKMCDYCKATKTGVIAAAKESGLKSITIEEKVLGKTKTIIF